ncbi:MAG: hypothetical protein AAF960_11860 [Bacteroidota bacterium]
MKDNRSKDNLEDLFRQSFNDAEKVNQADGWNVPSVDVWENIEDNLKEDKEDRKIVIWWPMIGIAASVLLVISGGQWWLYRQKIKGLADQLELNEKVVQEIQSDIKALNTLPKLPISPSFILKSDTKGKKTSTELKMAETVVNNFPNLPKKGNFSSTHSTVEHSSLLPTQSSIFNPTFEKKAPIDVEKSKPSIEQIPLLTKTNRSLAIPPRNLSIPTFPLPAPDKSANLYLAADLAPIWTGLRRVGDIPPSFQDFFAKNELQESSYTTGLKMGLGWGKGWSLETGIRYTNVQKRINHSQQILFSNLVEELRPNGDYTSTYALRVGSSSGAVETDVSLSRSSSTTVDDNTNLNLAISFSNQLTYLEIPLLLRKEWHLGKIGWSVKGGFSNRLLLNNRFDFQNIALDDSRFRSLPASAPIRSNAGLPSRHTMDYVLGVGVNYALQPNLQLYIEPTFNQSVQPIVDIGFRKIYTKNTMLQMGLKYTL